MPIRWLAPFVFLCLALGGCAAAVIGAGAGYGAVEFQNGVCTVAMPATFDPTWRATLAAMDQLGAEVKGKTRGSMEGRVRARLPDQTDVEITLGAGLSNDFTRVSIQVGLFGDETQSRAIAARIRGAIQ